VKGSLPRRYARALIELAQEERQLEPFGEQLRRLLEVLKKTPEILETLANDSFPQEERLEAMEEIAQKAGFHPLIKNFLLLLVRKDRIGLLPEIDREYRRFQDELLGIVRVRVAAPDLPERAVLSQIDRILGQKLKKKVISEGEAQPEIIGGLVLEIDHTVYDGSVRRELERMKETMLKS
jgi:F-type H+-transporting ATPase subunit delta